MTDHQRSGAANQNADRLDVTITYLRQTAPSPAPKPARPAAKIAILRAEEPPVQFYRYLYQLVGDPHKWVSRSMLSDDELAAIIHDPAVYIYVLYVNGSPAGIAEIDARSKGHAELKFFGIAPDFLGRGLGRYFLWNAIDLAWALRPGELRLETCSLDHPAALPLYQKFGFSVYDQKKGVVDISSIRRRQEGRDD